MDKYELVTIVDAAIPQEEKGTIMKEVSDSISKCDGKVINNQVWLEKHKFSFRMRSRMEGTYYLTNFESEHAGINKLRDLLRLNDKLLRTLIVRVN